MHIARHFCKLRINLSPRTPGCPCSLKTIGVRTTLGDLATRRSLGHGQGEPVQPDMALHKSKFIWLTLAAIPRYLHRQGVIHVCLQDDNRCCPSVRLTLAQRFDEQGVRRCLRVLTPLRVLRRCTTPLRPCDLFLVAPCRYLHAPVSVIIQGASSTIISLIVLRHCGGTYFH